MGEFRCDWSVARVITLDEFMQWPNDHTGLLSGSEAASGQNSPLTSSSVTPADRSSAYRRSAAGDSSSSQDSPLFA